MALKLAKSLKFAATGKTATFDLSDLQAAASALNIDWAKVWADVMQYGPGLVGFALTIASDAISLNWAKIVADLATLGPAQIAAVMAILADFGIVLSPPVPAPTP